MTQFISKAPQLEDTDKYPCPLCSKLLLPEEFNIHLKHCDAYHENNLETDRTSSYTVMACYEDSRIVCKYCGRKFMQERIAKHELACSNLVRKRPTFDMTKKIFLSLDNENPQILKSKKKIKVSKEFEDKMWHKQHKDFISNMRFARKLVEVEEKGMSTEGLKAPVSFSEELIECSVCHRKFAPVPAERHIPKCKDIIHKPKPPPLFREPSTKLPNIKKYKIKEMNIDLASNTNCSFSVMTSFSKCNFVAKSPSPNVSFNGYTERFKHFDTRKSVGNRNVFRCGFCGNICNKAEAGKHYAVCKGEVSAKSVVNYRAAKGVRCQYCEYDLLPNAHFCMMCGMKVPEHVQASG